MTVPASETFQQLVLKLYQSQLHFYLSETPYSAQITIRKRFLKDKDGPSPMFSSNSTPQNDEVENLTTQIIELKKTVENSSEVIEILEKKLATAETQAFKAFEEKKTQISVLNSSVRKSEDLVKELRKDLIDVHKVVKGKEKLIHQLEKKCENLNDNNENHKNELTRLKTENKKLLKSKAKSEKQIVRDLNQNCPSLAPPSKTFSAPFKAQASPLQDPEVLSCNPPHNAGDADKVKTSAWPLPSGYSSTPPWSQPLAELSMGTPRTPPGCPSDPAPQQVGTNGSEFVVEKDKNVERKSILSAEVQEILKEEKLDFAKLLEAVRNDKLPCDISRNEEDDDYNTFDYENYPDESCHFEIHDITDEEVKNDGTDKEMKHDEYDEPSKDFKCSIITVKL